MHVNIYIRSLCCSQHLDFSSLLFMPIVSSESWLTHLVLFGNNLHTCHNLLFCQPYFPPPLALPSYVQQPLGKHPFPKTESLVWWHSRWYTERSVSTQFWQQLPPSPLLSLQITAFLWLVFHLVLKFFSFACFFILCSPFHPCSSVGRKNADGKKFSSRGGRYGKKC